MQDVTIATLPHLSYPHPSSHKGQNGRVLIIGGSHLFHAASLWALEIACRIVDLVHYSSVPENNEIVHQAKQEFRGGIVIERKDIESYIQEDDVILIGPGMVRADKEKIANCELRIANVKDVEGIVDEGMQTYALTNYLLKKYPQKQWVIDAGALQMLELEYIPPKAILTPHQGEFEGLLGKVVGNQLSVISSLKSIEEKAVWFAKTYQCIVLRKGPEDIVATEKDMYRIQGGNAGMTKGGTGDVLAGLIAGLCTTTDPISATLLGSFVNKKAGDILFTRVGPYFNASDLVHTIPEALKELATLQGVHS